jgi:hypothetical protein
MGQGLTGFTVFSPWLALFDSASDIMLNCVERAFIPGASGTAVVVGVQRLVAPQHKAVAL